MYINYLKFIIQIGGSSVLASDIVLTLGQC